jgi:hypothetical protein
MNKINLKSVLKFWQEIIFIIALGILISGIIMNHQAAFHKGINIVFFGIFVLLLACLIRQFYWKSPVLGCILAFIFMLNSAYMTLGWLLELVQMTDTIGLFSLFLFIGLTTTAISMFVKYFKGLYRL